MCCHRSHLVKGGRRMLGTVWFSLCWKVLWLFMDTHTHTDGQAGSQTAMHTRGQGVQAQSCHLVRVGAETPLSLSYYTQVSASDCFFTCITLEGERKRNKRRKGKCMVFCSCMYAQADKALGVCGPPLPLCIQSNAQKCSLHGLSLAKTPPSTLAELQSLLKMLKGDFH